ncbi:hypothetical protein Bca4012_062863 [Brassica carinata]
MNSHIPKRNPKDRFLRSSKFITGEFVYSSRRFESCTVFHAKESIHEQMHHEVVSMSDGSAGEERAISEIAELDIMEAEQEIHV